MIEARSLTAEQIQHDVLDSDTVLLEFALGEERSWLWGLTSTTVVTVELPPRAAIDAAARSLYDALSVVSAGRAYTQSASVLSDMLLGPVARLINDDWRGKRLAVVATGALEYVPFAALPRPVGAAGGPSARRLHNRRAGTLALDHEVVALPSASIVAALRRDEQERPAAARTLAILADPVFETTDPESFARHNRRDPTGHQRPVRERPIVRPSSVCPSHVRRRRRSRC